MMDFDMYDPLRTIDSSKSSWKCRVRIQNLWKAINRQTKEYYGMNILLIDDSNSRVHAFSSAKYCEDIEKIGLTEGDIYILTNFKVKEFLGDETYRPVRSEKRIFFTKSTVIKKDLGEGISIEKYAFDLFHIGDIQKLGDDNRFLVDVAGFVENLEPLYTTVKDDHEKKRLKFQLYNGRFWVKVTLFDEVAEQYQDYLKKKNEDAVAIIMCCAKVNKYEGEVYLTNYPATRIYVNPTHYSCTQLKKRVDEDSTQHISSPEEEEKQILMTVQEIKSLTEDFVEKKISCKITVKKLDEKAQWYFRKCTGCVKELFLKKGTYSCQTCNRVIPYPDKRFRVASICSDSTASITILFQDCDIRRITGKTVDDIQADCMDEEEEEKFPPVLRQLLKQNYTVTLLLTKDNILNGSTVYDSDGIMETVEISGNHIPTATVIDQSYANNSEDKDDNPETPTTGRSTTIKTRARKSIPPVRYDPSDKVTGQPLKNIKTEKM